MILALLPSASAVLAGVHGDSPISQPTGAFPTSCFLLFEVGFEFSFLKLK